MRMCTYALRQAGIPAAHIRKENFSLERAAPLIEPPDTEPHLVRLRFRGREYLFGAQYPDTILKAARKAGISLPYSCEAGRCGNCAARCREGRVWLSNNEVLTERDLAKGLTLTCVGFPAGGDVTLEM